MRSAILLAFAGCVSFPPADEFACHSPSDCPAGRSCESNFCVVVDAGETIDSTACDTFASKQFVACQIPDPGSQLDLDLAGTYRYDTDFATFVDPTGATLHPPDQVVANARLISVAGMTIAAGTTLRVVGSRPLLVASWSTIIVNGTIDTSSNATATGAGANATACHPAVVGHDDQGGAGGGGGGGFSGTGGKGGSGDGNNTSGGAGGTVMTPALVGGCPGGHGGTGLQVGGVGGDGGGSIQLTARQSVSIGGTITAGGAGGAGAPETGGNGNGGGGGGGSGGCIGVESPMVTLGAGAIVASNGGGGGGGTNHTNPGGRGGDGSASATPAAAGAATSAGPGGAGSAGVTLDGAAGVNNAVFAAGGGGGAAGFVVITSKTHVIDPLALVSPPVTAVAQ